MADLKSVALARLQEIAAVLDVPVDHFFDGKVSSDRAAADECLQLWSLLKTKRGRQQAMAALRRAVDEEDH